MGNFQRHVSLILVVSIKRVQFWDQGGTFVTLWLRTLADYCYRYITHSPDIWRGHKCSFFSSSTKLNPSETKPQVTCIPMVWACSCWLLGFICPAQLIIPIVPTFAVFVMLLFWSNTCMSVYCFVFYILYISSPKLCIKGQPLGWKLWFYPVYTPRSMLMLVVAVLFCVSLVRAFQ